MKLVIAAGIYPPDIGGPATYAEKIADEFSKRGWNISVLTYSENTNLRKKESELTRKFNVVKISLGHNVFARYFLYTWNLIKLARKADVIYAQGPVSEGLPALIASKMAGKRYVLKIVGDPAWERLSSKEQNGNLKLEIGNYITRFIGLDAFQSFNDLNLKIKTLRWIERFVAKGADKIIVPSEYLKKIIMMWGIPEDKVKIIYNSVDAKEELDNNFQREIKKFQPKASRPPMAGDQPLAEKNKKIRGKTIKMEQEIGNLEGDIILSVGRLVPWKGFDVLIDLMPELLKINPKFKLVIAGDGPELGSLKSKVQSLKSGAIAALDRIEQSYSDRILLTGKLDHGELLKLMRKSKIFVLNSGYEGLSHVILEAMQAGLPCAVSDVGGNPELIENEKTGLLFGYNNEGEIKNAIVRLLKNEALREQVILGAREKMETFNFDQMIKETMGEIEKFQPKADQPMAERY